MINASELLVIKTRPFTVLNSLKSNSGFGDHLIFLFFPGGPSVRANNPQVRTGMTAELVTDDPHSYKICAEKEGQIPAVSTLFICEDPVSARYVSFHIYNDAPAALNFYEIDVHGVCN